MGTMALLVQMWMARCQSRPSRQPPLTETTFLACDFVSVNAFENGRERGEGEGRYGCGVDETRAAVATEVAVSV